jgi:hypothetical protein
LLASILILFLNISQIRLISKSFLFLDKGENISIFYYFLDEDFSKEIKLSILEELFLCAF